MKWYKSNIASFLYKILGFYLVWYLVYNLWLLPAGWLDAWVTKDIAWIGYHILNFLGYTAYVSGRNVGIIGTAGVFVANGCSGISQTGLFIGFVFAYPGRWIPRILFIIIGTGIIYLANIIRIVVLAITVAQWPQMFSTVHHYFATAVFYLIIFGLWAIWFNNDNKEMSGLLKLNRR